jgi:hypothetical protein
VVGNLPTISMEHVFMRENFSTLDIVKALSIPRERLRDWMNNGFVIPTISSQGQGTKAVFTRNDVYLAALFVDLLKKGFKRYNASDLIRKTSAILKKNEPKNLAYVIIYFLKNHDNPVIVKSIYDPVTRWDKIDLRWDGRISSKQIEGNKDNAPERNDLPAEKAMQNQSKAQLWENIHIVNFKNIKKEVDLQLSIFG